MADVSKIKLPSGVTYDIKDDGALPLSGGTVTGPVTFEDAVDMSDATAGDLVVNGNASFTNNINANTINNAVVGSSPKFTDEKIKLTSVTNDSEYPVLLGPTSITSGSAYSGDYNTDITINPNSKQLTLKSINLYYTDTCSAILATKGYVGNSTNHIPIVKFESMAANTSGTIDYYTYLSGVKTPTSDTSNYDTFVANKKYVDDKFGSIVVPTSATSSTTGISISNHSTGSVTGVQSSTTTASKITLGTAISVPNVTNVGSASTWTFEEKTIPNVTAAGSGSFTQGSFSGGSLTFAIDSTDNKRLNITFTAATHGADSHTHTAPTLGTAIKVQSKSGGGNGSAPTLGTAISVPNVTAATNVTVPIKNTSATTVVTSATHTVTDNGHTHNLS